MKVKINDYPIIPVFLFVLISFIGCTGNSSENKQDSPAEITSPAIIGNETLLLLDDLKENGDYINSNNYPSLIKASIVHESLEDNILLIDIRPSNLYSEGHIKGAVNIKFEELPDYFVSQIKPFEYDKIILVCGGGQFSSYTTSLLRLMGYGNVYAMRWGMSAWNNSNAQNGWLKGVSGAFESELESKVNDKAHKKGMPELNTGMNAGEEIGAKRFQELFSEGIENVLITAPEVFSDPQKYYIINLDRKDKYESGHIPGAVRYKPASTLGFTEEMATIPEDKIVVVYCGTGHNSGFATAYLRLFGYDARTLKFGNNSFMYDKMVEQKVAMSWLPFPKSEVNDFEVVK
jgi:rhodanese-related sulfurtransferase